ncbi:MAG: (Fe-S)-binding protein [Planctomycetes bacterium]|nr:(Fe-S)-binding protein [Planctomycetota bacterium]
MAKKLWSAHQREIDYCTYCPKLSRFVCPVGLATRSEAYTPTGKMTMLHLLRSGAVPYNAETAASAYKCTGCRSCTATCEHRIDVATVLEAARAESVRRGVAPPAVAEHDARVRSHGNPFGADLAKTAAEVVPAAYRGRRAEVGYFVGCATLRHSPQVVRDTIKLFEALGVDFGVHFPERWCSGYPSLSLGNVETFRALARGHRDALARYSVVVSGCPGCVRTMRDRYPEGKAALSAPVLHVSAFLERYLTQGKLKPARKYGKLVAWHDPCYLNRYLGVVEPPRRLLETATGAPPREFRWCRRDAACSGAGGGMTVTNRAIAREIARARVDEFRATGAEELVTGCPSCVRWLGKAGAPTRDLVSVLADSL